MNVLEDIINQLSQMSGPDRDMDQRLAKVLTWKQTSAAFRSAGVDGEEERIARLVPKRKGEGEVPAYTGSLQDAYIFARQIAPSMVGGAAWEHGQSSAQLGLDDAKEARTPELALLVAALTNLLNRLPAAPVTS